MLMVIRTYIDNKTTTSTCIDDIRTSTYAYGDCKKVSMYLRPMLTPRSTMVVLTVNISHVNVEILSSKPFFLVVNACENELNDVNN